MNLLDAQWFFSESEIALRQWLKEEGYKVSLGEAYRTKEQAEWYAAQGLGIKNSLHCLRLAIDLNIFKNRSLLTLDELRPIGAFWENLSQGEYRLRWGGNFTPPDYDHFSLVWHGAE